MAICSVCKLPMTPDHECIAALDAHIANLNILIAELRQEEDRLRAEIASEHLYPPSLESSRIAWTPFAHATITTASGTYPLNAQPLPASIPAAKSYYPDGTAVVPTVLPPVEMPVDLEPVASLGADDLARRNAERPVVSAE